MCENKNSKTTKIDIEECKKKCHKTRLRNFIDIIILLLPAIAYLSIFLLLSFINPPSPTYSIMLAIFALSVTLTFEVCEWRYTVSKRRTNKTLHPSSPILSSVVVFIILYILYSAISNLLKVPYRIEQMLPNFLTVVSLILYYLSTAIRLYLSVISKDGSSESDCICIEKR